MQFQVVVKAGPDAGRTFAIPAEGDFWIGRGTQSSTQLTDPSVSRMHCQLLLVNGLLCIRDKENSSGTFLNGRRIQEETASVGDKIAVGETLFQVESANAAEAATIAPRNRKANAGRSLAPLGNIQLSRSVVHKTDEPEVAEPQLESDTTVTIDPVKRASDSRDLRRLVGRTIYRYRIEEELVRGRYGTIFRAIEVKSNEQVALKVLWPHITQNEGERERFIRAMQTVRPIRHENLVRLLNAAMTEIQDMNLTLCWYAMEFIDGHNLRSVAQKHGVAGMLDWKNVWRVAVQMAKALKVAHENGIVHRSINPENILMPKTERIAKLGDLGLVKALEGTQGEEITRRGELVGEVAYMAPERTKGEPGDHRSDMFSLGVTLYEVLCGRRPFEATTVTDLISEIRDSEPLSPRLIQMSVDDRFEAIVLRLLEKISSRRFDTPDELLKELNRVGRYAGLIKSDMPD